jgi:STIP1 family protein 1
MSLSQAEQAKEYGNACLAKGKIDAAIAAYSEAICLSPMAAFYTNRAMAYKRKDDWKACIADCERALELDDRSIKAHYMLGNALAELGAHSRATEHLRRALGLTKQTSVSYEADIRRAMLAANKKVRAALMHARRAASQAPAPAVARRPARSWTCRPRACRAVRASLQRWESEIKDSIQAINATEQLLVGLAQHTAADTARVRRALDECRAMLQPERQLPDYLCCAISLELLDDPVVTPCGFTYERKCLEAHLAKRQFDPVSCKPLRPGQAVPNLAIKAAVEAFLAQHPWAYNCLD